ncbi:immunoglobulin-like domain-containing protein [Winogradskyella sp. A2]|uniref:immunoglobulin-like domain-containing protein n=1 Tax=Winogradskyella sp. A2 TaxID=3366944 RepID=UPI00398C58B4
MKVKLLLLIFAMSTSLVWAQSNKFWQEQNISSSTITKSSHQSLKAYQTFSLNTQALKQVLANAPQRDFSRNGSNLVLSFPNSEGKLERFAIMEASVMHPDLQARYPNIRSYVGQGIDDASSRIRFSLTPEGFNGMILSGNGPSTFIEPVSRNSSNYIVFNRRNRTDFNNDFECQVTERLNTTMSSGAIMKNADDSILRTYRLVVSATGEYTQYHGGTKAQALAAINTTMTRVNGIYETDFNVTMVLIANTDDVIYTSTTSDPYGNTTSGYNTQLQNTLTSVIGEANYDIGHLFANLQNNGNAGCIGCVCVNGQKGSGWTSLTTPEGDPFDVDYVAHEMGHQFGGNHTFTFSNEGTGAQMEPGSGSTIMGYAGITGATDVQSNSDPYFHAASVQQITDYIKTTSCQTNTNTGNAVPVVNAGSNHTIPRGTPFVLDGTATDADTGDVLTYCWEQFDVGSPATTNPSVNNTSGTAFRSFTPTTDTKRYFPRLSTVKTGATSWQWEAVPNVSRNLTFRLTVRDNQAGGGTNNSDDMVVSVTANAGPFVLNSPNTNVTWDAGTTRTVTWNVAGTTGNGVNAANVDIFLSTDGGDTYPIALATGVANDGSHDIVVPNNQGNQNRVMVKGANNIFFDISNTNFTIGAPVVCNATVPTGLAASNVATTTATLSWDAVPGASYDLRYREVGTSTWTTESVTGISSSLSGLTALTQYEAQVRSTCTGGATSAYSGLVNFTTTDVQLNYCNSASTNVNDEYISRVQLNTIDNSSGGQFYSDFTSVSTTLTKGAQYTVSITPTWTGTTYNEGYSVWIDYNRDGDFIDAGEQVFTQAPTQATPVSGNFTVPASAVENSTRMRVTLSYNANVGPCDSFTYGEVEDYTIIIEGSGPDTTPPVITLNGASPVDLTLGGTYTELGASATDNVDGDISANVVVGGDAVDTNTLGTYVVTYNVSDAAGNAATEVTRTVNVNEPSNGCSGGISTYPYNEGFEGSIGLWSQDSGDDLDWTVFSGSTPSSNTGPSSAIQGSDYIYVEASGNGTGYPNKRAIITSPCIDLNGVASASFDFQYHMFGAADMGTIDLEISDDEGASWTSIWSQSGNQGNQWNSQSVSLDAYVGGGVQLRFNRFVGSTWQADIAIDDVAITTSGPDVTPPVITLNGPSTLDLNVGDTYTEQGATATDNVDGNLTSSIVIGGDVVNTSVAGTYLVTYNVSDAAGNVAIEVVRTVNVLPDTTAPVITLNGSATINLNLGDTYTELGATATDNVDGDITTNIVIGGDIVDGNTAGTYLVTYNVSDAAGNAATEVVRTVNVIQDTTAPVITLIGSANISLELGDSFSDPGATATDNVDGDITANIVVGGDTVDTNTAGTYIITYNVSDAAGNAATQVTRTVTVNPDATPPVITLNGASVIELIEGDTYTELGATATDNIDGDITANIVIGGDVVDTNTVGTYLVTYNVSDASGNAANEVTRTVNVSAAPTCSDGIQNGDETGVDCGGSCAPCTPTDVILNEGYFETGWDSWIDGGSDCARRSDAARSYEGQYSIRIRDNSGVASSMTLNNIDVTSFNSVEVDFYFYVLSMENGEDFWLRFFDGSSWSTVQTWTRGVDINNNTFYNATVTITPAQYNFAVNSGFRFQNDASGNNDQIFIDQVTITGISSGSRGSKDKLEIVGYGEPEELSEFEISIYPNPVKGNIMNVEVSGVETFGYSIIDIVGKTVLKGKSDGSINVSKLDGGVYFIKVNDGDEIITKKFIKN